MPRITWSAQMSVGVPEIDRQHERLVDLFNGLEEGLVRGSASRIIRGLLAELTSYTKYHFTTEAHLLRMDDFRGLRQHMDAHSEFFGKLSELDPLLQRLGAESAALEASRFLRSWILRHIIVADRLAFAGRRTCLATTSTRAAGGRSNVVVGTADPEQSAAAGSHASTKPTSAASDVESAASGPLVPGGS